MNCLNLVKTSGLRWLCLMLVTAIPSAARHWALPFCVILAPSKRYYLDRNRPVRSLLERASLMLHMVWRWLPERQIVVAADSSFSALDFLDRVGRDMCFVTRLKLNAGLYDPPPGRVRRTLGHPRLKGARQPALREILKDCATDWHAPTVAKWYSLTERAIEFTTGTALWYHGGMPLVPLRWVLVRDPKGKLERKRPVIPF